MSIGAAKHSLQVFHPAPLRWRQGFTGFLLFRLLIIIRNHEIDSGADDFCAHFNRCCHHGNGGIGNSDYRAALKQWHKCSHENERPATYPSILMICNPNHGLFTQNPIPALSMLLATVKSR